MTESLLGLHHVTAMWSDAQRTLDFVTRVLGLRLVKRTVNFDDPGTHHFYFGDAQGRPGTLFTVFPIPGLPQGARGSGEAAATAFAVPPGSLEAWSQRLGSHGVAHITRLARFGEEGWAFAGPDGQRFELLETATDDASREAAWSGPVDPRHAVSGLHSVTLVVRNRQPTETLIADMGYRSGGSEHGRHRFQLEVGGLASRVDVVESRDLAHARLGAGSVHHVAWRTRDDGTQADWMQRLARRGQHVTPVQDRRYFRSVYFREPGGVLFEIATDPPGMTLDEPVDALGSELRLPPWLEPMRDRIESTLPRVMTLEPLRSPGP